MTETIMRRVIQHNSNCIDIGCHKGEILDVMLELAPEGKHTAFEPIPVFYNALIEKYKSKIDWKVFQINHKINFAPEFK